MRIREMRVSDAEQVASIQVAAWRKAYADILPAAYLNNLSVVKIAQNWKVGSEINPDVIRLVAENEKIVIGFAAGLENRTALKSLDIDAELWSIYVQPDSWRISVGTFLFFSFKERVAKDFVVWVLKDNHAARKFYEKFGGEMLEDRKQGFYGGKECEELCYLFRK